MFRLCAALCLTLATAVRAETEVDAYGLGFHAPVPESWLKLDEDLSIRLRILNASGRLAPNVPRPETLRAEVSIFGRAGAPDRQVSLTCSAYFIDAQAENSDYVTRGQPCWTGRLGQADGQFVVIDFDLRFRPVVTDPAGTSAVVVEVKDAVVNDHLSLSATYDWQGGRK